MPRQRTDDEQLALERAAYLTRFGLTQEEIATALGGDGAGIHQYTVSRWQQAALKEGLLDKRQVWTFHGKQLSPDRLALVEQIKPWSDLLERLQKVQTPNGVPVQRVHVFDTGAGTSDERLRRFSRPAATALLNVLRRSSTFAVTWGFTIHSIVDALESSGLDMPDKRIEFVPVCPEELGSASHRTSSSVLAERLHELVNPEAAREPAKRQPRPPSLHGVPPFTPFAFRDNPEFRSYLETFDSYRQIFGASEPHESGRASGRRVAPAIERADTLLTGIGARNRLVGGKFFFDQLTLHGRISREEIEEIVLGDIGGCLLPTATCSPDEVDKVDKLGELFNGLRRKHVEAIATRARDRGKPGVVIVSILDEAGTRADTLAAIVRSGIVNELIIDSRLADGLKQKLDDGEDLNFEL